MRKIIVIGMMLLAIVLVTGCGHKEPTEITTHVQKDAEICKGLSDGDTFLSSDGCNTCSCNLDKDGNVVGVICTEIGCVGCTNLEDCYNIQYTGEELKEAWNNLSDGDNNKGVVWVFFSDLNGLDFEEFEYFIFEDAGFVELIIHENELDNVILLNKEENFEGFFMNYIAEEDEIDEDICPQGQKLNYKGDCIETYEEECNSGCPDGQQCVLYRGCVDIKILLSEELE